jgi:hypothetical protein
MFYKIIREDPITDVLIFLETTDFKDAQHNHLSYTPKHVCSKLISAVDEAVPDDNVTVPHNYAQVKFSYPLFNQRLETVSEMTSVENSPYLCAVQAIRLFIDQIFKDFMDEMKTMSALDYEIYVTTEHTNAFERAFSDGQVHLRLSSQKCLAPLLSRDFPNERICVRPSNYGPQPIHEADEKLRFSRDQDIRAARFY